MKLLLLSLLIFIFSFTSRADKVEKAFTALKEFNYFKAKELFEKKLKSHPSPCYFGLAKISSQNDNPFYNVDSAYSYILKSEETFKYLKEKSISKYARFGFTMEAIQNLKQEISTQYYQLALKDHTIASFTNFLNQNPWAMETAKVTEIRDSLAYAQALSIGTSVSFKDFIDTYPNSELRETVQAEFDLAQFTEQTKNGKLLDYIVFIKSYPKHPYAKEAQNRIYQISTAPNTVDAYSKFIETYPENINVNVAWKKLYQLYMYNYSSQTLANFEKEYPQYPFKNEIEKDLDLMQLQLLPYKIGLKYGLMNLSGIPFSAPEYEYLGIFKEGLAVSAKNGKYGYINKNNEVIIPFLYDAGTDFDEGRALVELNGKSGIIDRTGAIILPIEFDDLGFFSETLIYAKKDSLYGYYDGFGRLRIEPKYQEAFAFQNGMAKVIVNEKEALINVYGSYIFPPAYESISLFKDSIFVFSEDELFGLTTKKGQIIQEAKYDRIGELISNRAIFLDGDLIGFFDELGKISIEPKFESFPNYLEIGTFKNGKCVVKLKGKFGIIDVNGKFVVPAIYNDMGAIGELIAVSKSNQYGFIDISNNMKIPLSYEYAESFVNSYAKVELLTLLGVINKNNKLIVPCAFTEIAFLTDKIIQVSDGSRQGLYSNTGQILAPSVYQTIRLINPDVLLLATPDKLSYFYIPKMTLIELKYDE